LFVWHFIIILLLLVAVQISEEIGDYKYWKILNSWLNFSALITKLRGCKISNICTPLL